MMMKSERVAGYTGAATVLQHARVVLPVCALGVKSVDSLIAVAKLALTSLGMPKLEFSMLVLLGFFLFYFICCFS